MIAPAFEPSAIRGMLDFRDGRLSGWTLPVQVSPERSEEGLPMFVSICEPLALASHGGTVEEAERSMRDMIEAFLEALAEFGTMERYLTERGWKRQPETSPVMRWTSPQLVRTLVSAPH